MDCPVDCTETQNLLNPYVDGELDLVRTVDIERHLHDCQGCSRKHDRLRAMHSAIGAASLAYTAPPGLEMRLRQALRQAGAPAAAKPAWRLPITSRWLALAASLLLNIGLLALTARMLLPTVWRPSATGLADEVLASHLRSLQGDHLLDIATSDRHTVKPWFNGKLDFSPMVPDLKDIGSPLDGGRLDYLAGRPVAALVYHHGGHKINVFTWPVSDASGSTPGVDSLRGYHLIRWASDGMNFWAVSDVNAADLQNFVDHFRQFPSTAGTPTTAPATRP